jgi:transposase-like protein
VTISSEEMARLYVHDELPLSQIAERAKVSKTTVWRRLKELDTPIRPSPSEEPLSADKAVEAYNSNGHSITKAARVLGVKYRDVRRALIRSGTYEPERLGGLAHLDEYHKSGDRTFRNSIMKLRSKGVSKSSIAKQLGTTRETVDYVIYLADHQLVPEATCQTTNTPTAESDPSKDSTPVDSSPESADKTISK